MYALRFDSERLRYTIDDDDLMIRVIRVLKEAWRNSKVTAPDLETLRTLYKKELLKVFDKVCDKLDESRESFNDTMESLANMKNPAMRGWLTVELQEANADWHVCELIIENNWFKKCVRADKI